MGRNTNLVGEMNKAAILSALRAQNKATIEELVLTTGISQPTVLKWLSILDSEGYVVSAGYGESTGGRPPVLYSFNQNAGFVVGVEVEVPHVRMAITNLKGQLLQSQGWRLSTDEEPLHIRDILVRRTKEFIESASIDHSRIRSIGLALTGFVDQQKGLSVSTPRIRGWHNVPVKHDFETAFGVPVHLMHEIDALSLAEIHGGAAAHKEQFIFVEVRYGLGARAYIDGQPIKGKLGNASLLGHTTVVPNGLPCICGNRGCLEMYASGRALIRQVKEVASHLEAGAPSKQALNENQLARWLFTAARTGDSFAASLRDNLVFYLSIGIANTINMFEVPNVVVGGFVTEGGEELRRQLKDACAARLQPILSLPLDVVFSSLDRETAGPYGASLFALEQDTLFAARPHLGDRPSPFSQPEKRLKRQAQSLIGSGGRPL